MCFRSAGSGAGPREQPHGSTSAGTGARTQSILLYVCVDPCSSQPRIDNHVSSRCADMEVAGTALAGSGDRVAKK